MKVRRRTRKSLEWTEDWQGRPAERVEEAQRPEAMQSSASMEPIGRKKREKPKSERRQRKKANVRESVGARDRRKAEAGKTRQKRARSPKGGPAGQKLRARRDTRRA
jgi:hypothetical protein